MTGHDPDQVPPFGHPRINAWLPTPRGLSQAPTSFFGSWCQGIHPVLLPTSPTRQHHPPHHHHDTRPGSRTRDRSTMSTSPAKTKDARVHCAVLNQQPGTHPSAPTRHHPPPPTRAIGTSRSEDQAEPTKANTPPPPTTEEPPLRGSPHHGGAHSTRHRPTTAERHHQSATGSLFPQDPTVCTTTQLTPTPTIHTHPAPPHPPPAGNRPGDTRPAVRVEDRRIPSTASRSAFHPRAPALRTRPAPPGQQPHEHGGPDGPTQQTAPPPHPHPRTGTDPEGPAPHPDARTQRAASSLERR